jgi:uncharacterized protein (TIRG00374 family)
MTKSKISIVMGLLLGIALFIGWLFTFDFNYLVNAFRSIRYSYVILAGVIYLAAYFIRSVRWNLLLRNQVRLTYKESWLISTAGNWVNYLIPIRAGELIKALLIKKIKQVSAVSILPSVFIDKFFDTLGIFFVLSLIPFLPLHISKGLRILIILLIAMFVLVFLILFLAAKSKGRITNVLQLFFFWLPKSIREKIFNLIEMFIDGLNIFEHHYTIILYCVLLTMTGVFFDAVYFYLIFQAFNANISFLIVLFGYTLINLSYALPQPPAQLGSNEWMMIIIFSIGFGLTKNIASTIMAFAHIYTAVIISVLGIIGFSYSGIKSLKQIKVMQD